MSARIDAGTREASPPWLEERCDIADIVPDESSPIPPSLTIVVPTRNEAENVGPLFERLDRCLPGQVLEIIFVDDSDDDTVAAIESLERSPDRVIRVIHRPRGERQGGLGGAVVVGLRAARADWVCVMDADLQHPPEVIPSLLERARATHADLVIASRYCGDGSLGRMGELRAAASRATTILAKIVFPGRLRGVTDPMSGFFLVCRRAVDPDSLRPCGFKILLEILIRTDGLQVAEVPYRFGERHAGESKASLREAIRYLMLLWQLRLSDQTRRFVRFAAVGASGLGVNTLALLAFAEIQGLHYLVAAALATQVSTLWLYLLTESFVFRGRAGTRGPLARMGLYFGMNNAALLFRGPLMYALTSVFGIFYVASNLISLLALTALRFAVADTWIWDATRRSRRAAAPALYNIHDIVTVRSTVPLPELEQFRVEALDGPPTIDVRTQARRPHRVTAERHFQYDERLGVFGFWIDVSLGDLIDVVASPLLARSPHVLYTNVVEPILRWTFVQRGYALIHGACIAYDDHAYLVTARTDTGKTTTVLRMLDRQRRESATAAFISDDLTLVTSEGTVLTYPKPLTISKHTVSALNRPALTRRERLGLPIQSRIHSRGGRRFAFLLTRSRLPVATINALAQWLVPPPKYPVQRLIPQVKLAREARLEGLFVIERGADDEFRLDPDEMLDILMSNCEDAYGFPPYPAIRGHLLQANGQDLSVVERQIVQRALAGVPGRLIRSSSMDWAQRIPALISAPAPSREPLPGGLAIDGAVPEPGTGG